MVVMLLCISIMQSYKVTVWRLLAILLAYIVLVHLSIVTMQGCNTTV